jgi:hypothetical protein
MPCGDAWEDNSLFVKDSVSLSPHASRGSPRRHRPLTRPVNDGTMTALSRRNVLKGAIAAAGAAAVAPSLVVPAHAARPSAVPLVRNRLTLPSGISTGDVTTNSGVLWSRASGPGRLVANLLAIDEDGSPLRGSRAFSRVLRGTTGSDATDFTSKIHARDLPSGTRFALTMHFEDRGRQRRGDRPRLIQHRARLERQQPVVPQRRQQARPELRLDRRHRGPGLGHQRGDRRHARVCGHARHQAGLLHPLG